MSKIISAMGVVLAVVSGFAAEEREVFQKWHIGVGGAFNFGVNANLHSRNLPVPQVYAIPASSTKTAAENRAADREYDGGGYIKPDDNNNGWSTTNWKLPASAYRGDGKFELDNAYQEVTPGEVTHFRRDNSDDEWQFGLSVELSRELWIHDEAEEHRWGVDFAAAFSYFFQRDLYSAQGRLSRVDSLRNGVIRTDVNDPDAMFKYDVEGVSYDDDGMYGPGSQVHNPLAPALGIVNPYLGSPYDRGVSDPSIPKESSNLYSASGDYRELEMLFMFRPWYEIKDWWRVYAEIGVGVSWGRFDSSFHGGGISDREKFTQWDVYGVAGLGMAFRYDEWTLGIDFLGRFLRDDLDVDGRYVNGSIERSDWGFRVMLGYEF